jgi:hypothetical protein
VTEKISLVVATGLLFFSLGIGPVAHAQLAPFPGTKSLLSGSDPVGIGQDVATKFSFTITLNANNFNATDTVMDVVPAELDVTNLFSTCGGVDFLEGKGWNLGGPAGGQGDAAFKLAPDFILWDLVECNTSEAQTLTVEIETDLNPGHYKRGIAFYEPTSCGPLFLNDGAVLVSGENDEPSTEPSNALMVATCPDENDSESCVDADNDGWSVACGDVEGCVPADEICDGLDNDCDGIVDNDLGQTTCGMGICEVTVDSCVDGEPQECIPGTPDFSENCNNDLDDNCDGEVNEGCEDPS